MGDSRNGNIVYGDQRRHAAADVHKRAERLKVRHPGLGHVARREVAEAVGEAFLLHLRAGKNGHNVLSVPCNVYNAESHRLVDPRDDGDFPRRPLPDAHSRLLAGHEPGESAHLYEQIVVLVAQNRAPLQDRSLYHRPLQVELGPLRGVLCMRRHAAFRFIDSHVFVLLCLLLYRYVSVRASIPAACRGKRSETDNSLHNF